MDNFKQSASLDIIKCLKNLAIKSIIYAPALKESLFYNMEQINDLEEFKRKSSVILANRIDPELTGIFEKVYTRDLLIRD